MRDLYTTYPTGAAIQPGAVLAKRVYRRKPDGSKGDLTLVFVMHKQNSGYFPQGGDFNYYLIPGNTVTAQMPNGDFSQVNRTPALFAKATACADCHARAAGGDYLFSR
jgi:cytochrome c553